MDEIFFCCGHSLEEDLRWEPRLGALVDLVEFENGLTDGGAALCKTVEAFSRGTSFFSTSEGGGAGREMMDSNAQSFACNIEP